MPYLLVIFYVDSNKKMNLQTERCFQWMDCIFALLNYRLSVNFVFSAFVSVAFNK